MVVMPISFCCLMSSLRVLTRSAASRFESGSSNRNTLGSRTMARPERDALALAAGERVGLAAEVW